MEINLDALPHRKEKAPKYNPSEERHDPFDVDIITRMVKNQTLSVVLKRKIESPADAYEHAEALCLIWQQEDKDIAEELERQQELARVENVLQHLPTLDGAVPPIKVPHGTQKQQVEFARLQWKAAVKWRNEQDDRMRVHVESAHDLYKSLRGVN